MGLFCIYGSAALDQEITNIFIKEKRIMDMKEKLQELAEAAKKRIDESEGLDK